MKIKYYGTGAAEGIPGMFCRCDVCEAARRLGGKNVRTRSQAMLDGRLLIDFPPDTFLHCLYGGLDLPSVTDLLLTHAHSDHLYTEDLENRKHGFSYANGDKEALEEPLRIYATKAAIAHLRNIDEGKAEDCGAIELYQVKPYKPFQVQDYTVTALPADHSQRHGAVFYMIEREGQTMLYANDTGYFPEEVWDFFARTKPRLDFASLDCTEMILDTRHGHMSLPVNDEVRQRLTELGCADERTVFCAHHFSHNGGLNHDDLVKAAAQYGLLVSYDGMELTI